MEEPRKIVVILGNGFDVDLGLKTLYKDFWESKYCPKDYPAPLIFHLNSHGINTKGKRSPDGRLLEYLENRIIARGIVDALTARGLDAGRYRLLAKLQLTEPGKGRHPGLLRNYLADANCDATQIRVTVPGYTEQVGFELEQIQVYARFLLLDNVTGYRSQYQEYSTLLTAL